LTCNIINIKTKRDREDSDTPHRRDTKYATPSVLCGNSVHVYMLAAHGHALSKGLALARVQQLLDCEHPLHGGRMGVVEEGVEGVRIEIAQVRL